jgi:hypothetical protein
MVVNYQRKGTKGQTMIYKTLHRKQMTEQHVYIAARKQVAFLSLSIGHKKALNSLAKVISWL